MADKDRTQKTTRSFDRENVVWTGVHLPSNATAVCPAWQLFCADVSEVESDGTPRPADEIAADFKAAQHKAQTYVAGLPEIIRFAIGEWINRDLGDMLNTKGAKPVPVLVKAWSDRCNGVLPSSGGGGLDPRVEQFRIILRNAAMKTLQLGKTDAMKRATDDSAKLAAEVAKKRKVAVVEFNKTLNAATDAAMI